MRPKAKFTRVPISDLEKKISGDYASGVALDEIAEKYGVNRTYIRYAVMRTCTPLRIPEYSAGKVRALKRAGWSDEKIADEFNSSVEIVRKFRAERGI